ncbi:MAG: glycosyltransferase family 39 protein [Rhodospirillales bacterium]
MAENAPRLSCLPANLLDRNLAILSERPGVPGIVLILVLSLMFIRAGLFPGTGGDDGEQLIFSQFFDWGYQVRNPPLYTWLVIALSSVTGPTLWAVNIVKFTLLAGMYLMLWRAARYVIQDRRLAALAGLAPVLLYYIAWEAVTGFSHTVLAASLYAALIWVVLRLRDQATARLSDYLLLGLVIGLGAMAKYAFWIFLVSLLATSMLDTVLRRRLLTWRLLLSFAVATAVAVPHYLWLFDRLDILSGQAGQTVAAGGLSFKGLGHGVKAAVGFLAPFWLIALVCFPAAFKPVPDSITARHHPMIRVIGWQMVLILAGTAIGTLLLPEFRIRTHYMTVLLLFPIWIMARAEATVPNERRIGAFGAVLSLALLAGPVGLTGKYLFEPLTCKRCQHHVPYDPLSEKIQDMGFKGGTIVASWHPDPLPGNLRAVFPHTRVVSAKHKDVIPPLKKNASGQCLIVWSADAARDNRSPAVAAANEILHAGISLDTKQQLITAPLAGIPSLTQGKAAILGVILADGRGNCR